jgi:muramoyltetrapeptide carboxypeptidase
MQQRNIRIGVTAPASRIGPALAGRVSALAAAQFPDRTPELVFHPQCYLASGHFAGDDEARAAAFLDIANDGSIDVLWFARGGYGSGRLAESILPALNSAARKKTYLGYSDAGALFGAMYAHGFQNLVHGPMPADLLREGGEAAVRRVLAFLVDADPSSVEPSVSSSQPTAAFNITILSHLLGTPFEPDLSGHVLMLEDVSEHMYRIDRALLQITSSPNIRGVAGIRLGRCSAIPPNDPPFGQSEEEVVKHWCAVSAIPYLGRADIGHDIDNKIVPFGRLSHI